MVIDNIPSLSRFLLLRVYIYSRLKFQQTHATAFLYLASPSPISQFLLEQKGDREMRAPKPSCKFLGSFKRAKRGINTCWVVCVSSVVSTGWRRRRATSASSTAVGATAATRISTFGAGQDPVCYNLTFGC